MTSNPDSPEQSPLPLYSDIKELRKDLLRLLLLALPIMFVDLAVKSFQKRLASQPWQALWILLPLTLTAWIFWQIVKGRKAFRLRGAFLGFFVCYSLIFTIAASSALLDWKRTPVGYEGTVPRNFLIPKPLGDWRYYFLPPDPRDDHLLVVLMPRDQSLDELRADLRILLRMAELNGGKGVAFDFFFPYAASPAVDHLLCSEIETARRQKVAVVVGYTYYTPLQTMTQQVPSGTLECMRPEDRGHLVVFQDSDDGVRSVPLYFLGDRTLPSLSLRVASRITDKKEEELTQPEDGLLQFTASSSLPQSLSYADLRSNPQNAGVLRDRWVIAGAESRADSFQTPFGKLPGVMLHALSIESLVHGRYISRIPWWQNLFLVFTFCYILTALVAQGVPVRRLLLFVAISSLAAMGLSIVAIRIWRVWIDVIYFIVAVWLLMAVLVGWRRWAGES